ncbi:J domain-containing protein [Brevundimonas sp.]|uniref:J domain-containing protein n=1 Tax=Brevundimonas sp. TaxID=1871086 RepID=UPI002489E333|nr:J domain-containing protein [Brevundimonas sp.]MDI1280579.1 J domain-containing protein [Brevundimonas sp.]
MSADFQYTPRFKDMRIKPQRAEEEAAEKDVLHLKPGEKACDWPDCSKPATARAPKSRERLNDFYDFCQSHAGTYNKNWNFYAGMSEGQVRAAQENEAMTGGRPTWDMKASKNSREAAGNAAKLGKAHTGPSGSWSNSFGLFDRRTQEQVNPADDHRVGKLERAAMSDLGLEPGAEKSDIKARYHEMLKRFHPDTNGGDRGAEAKLQSVIRAWKILKKAGLA